MVQEQFNFSAEAQIYPGNYCLAMQVSSTCFSFCIYDPEAQQLLELKRYVFKNIDETLLQEIIDKNPQLEGYFDKIITALDFGFSSLLPAAMTDADAAPLMYLENADQQDHVITEIIEERNIANRYAVSPGILTWLVHHFPSSAFLHTHTVQIQSISNSFGDGLLKVDIAEKSFTVQAFKGELLLLSKTYAYQAATDIAFYLLKTCEVFDLRQEQVSVQLSGLIDVNSKLYRELYDYFLHITFKPAGWTDTISNQPAHYFTFLNEMIQCELFQVA